MKQSLKKGNLSVLEFMLKSKMLSDELEPAGCGISEEQKLMTVLGGLDESYDNVFSTLTKIILKEVVTLDDAKALLLSHM